MKYFNRLKLYKANNVVFNPETLEAHSYRWWRFVAKIDGLVLFNNYRYSNSTSKHQSKVRSVLSQLGIQVDHYLKLPKGINGSNLTEIFVEAEETLCNQYLNEELKREQRNERAKHRRLERKLTDYLENSCCFRDYEIKPRSQFGKFNKVAVHQCVDRDSLESDVQNALHSFHRDAFGSVVFYV